MHTLPFTPQVSPTASCQWLWLVELQANFEGINSGAIPWLCHLWQPHTTWSNPMIFEPQSKIRFTWSSYQVTTFLYFALHVNSFNKVKKYLEDYWGDLQYPTYFERIKHVSTNTGSSPLLDDQDFAAFQRLEYCQCLPFACSTRLKVDRYLLEIEYLFDLFSSTYHKFLNALDYIDFHPSNMAGNGSLTTIKHTAWLDHSDFYHPSPSNLMPSEEKLLDCLMVTLKRWTLSYMLGCQGLSGLASWPGS